MACWSVCPQAARTARWLLSPVLAMLPSADLPRHGGTLLVPQRSYAVPGYLRVRELQLREDLAG
jgi:hypothetical protein